MHSHPTHVQSLSLNTNLHPHLTFSFSSMCDWKTNCKNKHKEIIIIRDHLSILPLVFPPLWEISLSCATKWGPLMTEVSLFVSASPSHHSLSLFLDSSVLVCFPPSHSSSHRIWVSTTEVKVSYSLPAAGSSDPCSAHCRITPAVSACSTVGTGCKRTSVQGS